MKLIKIENHPLSFAVGHQFDIESTTNESAHANFPDSIQSRVTNGPPPKRHSNGVVGPIVTHFNMLTGLVLIILLRRSAMV